MHILLTREASGPPVHHARQCGRRGFAVLAVVMLSLGLVNPAMTQPSLTLQAALDEAQARSATLQAQHAAARAAMQRGQPSPPTRRRCKLRCARNSAPPKP